MLKKGQVKIRQDSDIMIDQVRAIDNNRLIKKAGVLPKDIFELVKENINIILDLNNIRRDNQLSHNQLFIKIEIPG